MSKITVATNRISDAFDMQLLKDLNTTCASCEYKPCAAGAESALGFIAPMSDKPAEFAWRHQEFIYLRICHEVRKPPADLVNSIADKRIAIASEKCELTLDDTLQITEQVRIELWENIAPKRSFYWMAIHTPTHMVYNICSAKNAEDHNALMRKAIGTFPVEGAFDGSGLYYAVEKFIGSKKADVLSGYGIDFVDVLHLKSIGTGEDKVSVKLGGFDDLQTDTVRDHWRNIQRLDKVGVFFRETENFAVVTPSGTFQFEQVEGDEDTWDQFGGQAQVIFDAATVHDMFLNLSAVAKDFAPERIKVELQLP